MANKINLSDKIKRLRDQPGVQAPGELVEFPGLSELLAGRSMTEVSSNTLSTTNRYFKSLLELINLYALSGIIDEDSRFSNVSAIISTIKSTMPSKSTKFCHVIANELTRQYQKWSELNSLQVLVAPVEELPVEVSTDAVTIQLNSTDPDIMRLKGTYVVSFIEDSFHYQRSKQSSDELDVRIVYNSLSQCWFFVVNDERVGKIRLVEYEFAPIDEIPIDHWTFLNGVFTDLRVSRSHEPSTQMLKSINEQKRITEHVLVSTFFSPIIFKLFNHTINNMIFLVYTSF